MLRLYIFMLISLVPGCTGNSTKVESTVYDIPIIDPSNLASIERWENSEYNYNGAKITVVELHYFGGAFGDTPSEDATPIALEVCGAKVTGVSAEQQSTIEQLTENEKTVHAAVRAAVYGYYKQTYSDYKSAWSTGAAMFGGGDFSDVLPVVTKGDELDNLVQLSSIYIHPGTNGVAPIGFDFAIPWDEENGLGVLLQGETVIATGNSYEAMPVPQQQ
jgi:hypothetical protein